MRDVLAGLAMEGATFAAAVSPRDGYGPSGGDDVEFLIAPNPGVPAGPLREIASGGELSRVMLALMSVAAAAGPATLVFDEVDAGIGGQTARAVGEQLRALAAGRQVLCITHLPQIASLADRHFTIVKDTSVGPGPHHRRPARARRRRRRRSSACWARTAATWRRAATRRSCSRPRDGRSRRPRARGARRPAASPPARPPPPAASRASPPAAPPRSARRLARVAARRLARVSGRAPGRRPATLRPLYALPAREGRTRSAGRAEPTFVPQDRHAAIFFPPAADTGLLGRRST